MTYTVSSEWVADAIIRDWATRGIIATKKRVGISWVVTA